ncbi:acyltransferase [Leptospira fainei serovar Hurstbridge str. BUT 6]|uniref:Acyltransferase n=1 Tax=Leptospira fainei serovar Hurstbridge str. BUT 6 TaxID=1193011 RepID=S3VGV6_9LEPT|nr:acyltransferase [Leptospira fainei]EPG75715.1 acyltransferase [Leptospira fainei serovar Hurstbridge str. BUT 6]
MHYTFSKHQIYRIAFTILISPLKSIFRRKEEERQSLNGFRFFAITFVLFYHFWLVGKNYVAFPQWLDRIFLNLSSGVDLFFILSGFLIYGELLKSWKIQKELNLPTFYKNRVFRIFPAYYLFIAITLPVTYSTLKNLLDNPFFPVADKEKFQLQLSNWFYDLIYFSNYKYGINGHTWSLASEWQFYLILPLLCLTILFKLRKRLRIAFLVLLYFIPLGFRIFLHQEVLEEGEYFTRIYYPLHTRFDAFIIGMLLAEWLAENQSKRFNEAFQVLLIIISLSALVFAHYLIFEPKDILFLSFRFNILNVGYGILIALSLISNSLLSNFFSFGWFIPITRVSYGMYLWHPYVAFKYAGELSKEAFFNNNSIEWSGFLLLFFKVYLNTFLIAVLSYCAFEYWFLRMKKSLSGKSAG